MTEEQKAYIERALSVMAQQIASLSMRVEMLEWRNAPPMPTSLAKPHVLWEGEARLSGRFPEDVWLAVAHLIGDGISSDVADSDDRVHIVITEAQS